MGKSAGIKAGDGVQIHTLRKERHGCKRESTGETPVRTISKSRCSSVAERQG